VPVGRIIDLAPGEDGFFTRLIRDFDIHVDDAGIFPGVLFFDRDPVEDVGQGIAVIAVRAEENEAAVIPPDRFLGRHAPQRQGGQDDGRFAPDLAADEDGFGMVQGDRRRVVEKVIRLGAQGKSRKENRENRAGDRSFHFHSSAPSYVPRPRFASRVFRKARFRLYYPSGGGMSTAVFFSEGGFSCLRLALPGNWSRPQPPLSGRKGHPRGERE